ncbi:integrase core domain-containing protein [Paracoccus sp. JM45]|uniref:integrase core domain-containing protein n=1 Tax=Paracoccus sp. JM45 TaxID=2283626 RepID=UPI000E6CFFD1|nr:hypothetical protein DWB67_10860 [Paracoccus sp. JM45]
MSPNFTSTGFTNVLRDEKMKISRDGSGRWTDNPMIKRLWRSLKYVCVNLIALQTGSEARRGIAVWITCSNVRRPPSSHRLPTTDEAYDSQSLDLKIAA